MNDQLFSIKSIGAVRQFDGQMLIEIDGNFRDGLQGIEEFSHVIVSWYFNLVSWDEKTLKIPPCYRLLQHDIGVFATRGPFRPNGLALSVCQLLKVDVEQGLLYLDWIDAEDQSPVFDLKPYHPSADLVQSFRMPAWCAHWPASREESADFDWSREFTF